MIAELTVFYTSLAIAFGLLLGSFFNVLIYRLPRKESIIFPGSHCIKCNHSINPLENIPVFSFLFLGGKCSECKTKISIQYPIIELITGGCVFILFTFLLKPAIIHNASTFTIIHLFFSISFLVILIPVSVIDIYHLIIPDTITIPAFFIAIAIAFLPGDITPVQSLLGILAGGGTLFIIGTIGERLLKKGEVMGGGDIKLMAAAGAFFGWKVSLLAIVFAAFLGSIVGIILIVLKATDKDHKLPFGPFLASGIFTAVLVGNQIIHAYLLGIDTLLLSKY